LVSELITDIDDNGRVQLPLAIRYGLHLMPGDKIAVDHLGDGTIILKKIIERSQVAEEIDRVRGRRQQTKHSTSSPAKGYSRPLQILAQPR